MKQLNCIVCLKKLEKGENELCSACHEYLSFVYKNEPEKVYEEPEDGQEELAQEQDEAEDRSGDSIIDELKELWEATLILSLIFIIAAFLFYKKRVR